MNDRVSFAAGLACLLVGVAFGLDQLGALRVGLGLALAIICAAAGFVLVVSGLEPRRRGDDHNSER